MVLADRLYDGSRWSWAGQALAGVALAALIAILVTIRLTQVGGVALLAIAMVGCFVFWRLGVCAVVIVVALEGFLRNVVDSPLVLAVKDLMLAAIYLRVFGEQVLKHQRLLPASPANVPILLFAGLVLVQTLNPSVVSRDEAAIGVHTWLYYVPLFFVAAEMVRTQRDAWRYSVFLLVVAVPVCAIAIYQAVAGPAAYSALGGAFAQATFVVSQDASHAFAYRPNATFAWSSHFAIFAAIATIVACALMLRESGVRRIIAMTLFAFLVATDVIEGQRSFFVLLPLILILIIWLQRAIAAGLATIAAALVIGALVVSIPWALGVTSYSAFDRPLSLFFGPERQDLSVRAGAYLAVIWQSIQASPIGLGTGATSIGTRYALGYIPLFVESAPAKLIGDLSLAGLALFAWLAVVLVRSTVKVCSAARRAGNRSLGAYAAAVLGVQVLVLYTGTDIAVAAIVFWFLCGSVVNLPEACASPALVEQRRAAWSSP